MNFNYIKNHSFNQVNRNHPKLHHVLFMYMNHILISQLIDIFVIFINQHCHIVYCFNTSISFG